jgi:hypothetical protein
MIYLYSEIFFFKSIPAHVNIVKLSLGDNFKAFS